MFFKRKNTKHLQGSIIGVACTPALLGSRPNARRSLEIILQAITAPFGLDVQNNVEGSQNGPIADMEKPILWNNDINVELRDRLKRFANMLQN